MELAAQQVLRAVRGRRSQLVLSRQLGYAGNPVANWETGRRFPTAHEFLRICEHVGIDVQAAFERFLPAAAAGRQVAADLPGWLSDLRGSSPLTSIAAESGYSRFAVSRFLKGKAEPRLPVFLALVETMSGRASDLCAELVAIDLVPALQPSHARRQAARFLALHEPWTEAILRVLETTAYRDSGADSLAFVTEQLAANPGVDREVVARCFERLLAAGLVEHDGHRYRGTGTMTVDTQATAEVLRRVRAHWTEAALGRIPNELPGDQFGYNVFCVDGSDMERISGVLRAAFREIRAIVANSKRCERVALVNLQLLQLTQPAQAPLSGDQDDRFDPFRPHLD